MARFGLYSPIFFIAMLWSSFPLPWQATAQDRSWLEVDIGIIGAASEDVLAQVFDDVERDGHEGIVIILDTPGGALENTRNMVKQVMASPVPVAVWVGPAGSRAGSAGAFVTLSAHVAAMAPGTNIGAATPIQASGQDVGESDLGDKVKNDTIAFIESIAAKRGRNIEIARSFVETALAITAEEALEKQTIDLLAPDLPALYTLMDGREVELAEGVKTTLQTSLVTRVRYERSFRQQVLEILSNPNLFYLLFLAGIIGLGFELTHPGALFPGIAGGICLILALIATSVLPISYGAAALILVGVALLVAEAFIPSFGILGIGGVVAFVIGSIFLVDPSGSQGLRVSWYTIAPGAAVMAVVGLAIGYLVLRSETAPVQSGREAIVGAKGTVIGELVNGSGQARVQGAIWSVRDVSSQETGSLGKGDKVRVVKVDGLTLEVVREA